MMSPIESRGKFASVNGLEIWYETFGSQEDPALLLVMGGGCQGVLWPVDFCEKFAKEGFYVIRYDHRDAGLSTYINFADNPYDLMDVTKDALGLLDFLHVKQAHLFGISMGGLVAEIMAAYFPERVHSIIIMGSTSDVRPMNLAIKGEPPEEGALSSPVSEYRTWRGPVPQKPYDQDEKFLERRVNIWHWMSGSVPFDRVFYHSLHKEWLARLKNTDSLPNHYLASARSEDLVREVPNQVQVPTLILQGSEDPVFRPDHGEALSKAIKGATYLLVEGMGHVPNVFFDDFIIEQIRLHSMTK
jgi:pimeloyl-ACP methyl ester carboxylesterase